MKGTKEIGAKNVETNEKNKMIETRQTKYQRKRREKQGNVVNFYPLTHPILARTKNQTLTVFWRIYLNSQKKYPQRRILEKTKNNNNILEFKRGSICYINLK